MYRPKIFSVYLISINRLIPIQTLISSSSFTEIPMPIISIQVFIFFQRLIFAGLKKNCFNFFPVLQDYSTGAFYALTIFVE